MVVTYDPVADSMLGLVGVVIYGVTGTGVFVLGWEGAERKLQAEVGIQIELDEPELGFGQHGLKARELAVERLGVLGNKVKV